jgi:hypothetical protein
MRIRGKVFTLSLVQYWNIFAHANSISKRGLSNCRWIMKRLIHRLVRTTCI